MESWAAATPPGRSGGTSASHRSRCPTAVLAVSALDNRVLFFPELELRNLFLPQATGKLCSTWRFEVSGAAGAIESQTRLPILGLQPEV